MDFFAPLYHDDVKSGCVVVAVQMVAFDRLLNPVTVYVADYHIVVLRLSQHWAVVVEEIY